MSSTNSLFSPIKSVDPSYYTMAPLTRYRADDNHVHDDLAVEYYAQRGSTPGTLLITEATFISEKAGGYDNVPGLYNAAQVDAWKRVTDAVHANGSFIYAQLWALGRSAHAHVLKRDNDLPYVSSSPKPLKGPAEVPRALTVPEIKEYVQAYATAAKNAIEAGFDGVEVHGANGFLVDQFLQDVVNERTDEYGGSIENRSRFGLEVLQAIVAAVGQDRVGVRLSPWNLYEGMRIMDPIPQFTHFITSIRDAYPNFAYIHFIEPDLDRNPDDTGSNDPFRALWAPRPFLSANGYTPENAEMAANKGDIVAFGRYFISNHILTSGPYNSLTLPVRLQKNTPLTPYNSNTFYLKMSPVGYIDYPFAEDVQAKQSEIVLEQARL
ncbi:putative NADPH2 dehydrogenase chain OYE2 [Hysterangium stoloniferum]|nr:putative NADPH2 dehydrogenase chain OYE2 [Hysterangium stoloniferum]